MSNQVWSSLRASAPRGQRYFIDQQDSNWLNYLRKAAEVDGGEPHLCHVLKHISVVQEERDGKRPGVDPTARFPWLTPVIGSGCAGALSSKQIAELSTLPAKLAASCPDLDLPDGLSRAELVFGFACGLVETRHSGLTFAPMDEAVSQRSPELETTLRCVEATALLFRARHAALAYTGTPVRESEFMRLPHDRIEIQELHYSRLLPARKLLQELSAQAHDGAGQEVLKAHQDLFNALLLKVKELPETEFRVTSRDLGALVEVAWQLMIAPLGIYPGWRDLMTLSAFSSFEEELRQDFSVLDTRQARPRFETLSGFAPQLKRVRATMGTATKIAEKERGERSERTQFFDALARVLRLQSEYRTVRGSGPFTSAFVTAFDLELELALARQGADFTLVVPYYLTHGPKPTSPEHIAPIWLATHVKSSEVVLNNQGCWESTFDDKGQYVSGFQPRWRLANITRSGDPLVVVRLVGSPLMPEALMAPPGRAHQLITLPDGSKRKEDLLYIGPDTCNEYDESLSDGLPGALKERGVEISTPIRLDPALVIDEYSGLHRIKSSWTSTFPNDLTQADGSTFRYWCGAGLQLDDSLIRLLTAAYLEPMPTERSMAESSGAVVNRSFALPQADFLRWQGFAPVKDDYRVLIPELNHLADHLASEIGALARRRVDQTVVLGESFPDPHFECEIPFPRAEPGRIVDVIESAGDVT